MNKSFNLRFSPTLYSSISLLTLTTTGVLTPFSSPLYTSIRYFSASKIRYTSDSEDDTSNSDDNTSKPIRKISEIEAKSADAHRDMWTAEIEIDKYKKQNDEILAIAPLGLKKDEGITLTEEEDKKLHEVVKAETFDNFHPSSYVMSIALEREANRERITELEKEIESHKADIDEYCKQSPLIQAKVEKQLKDMQENIAIRELEKNEIIDKLEKEDKEKSEIDELKKELKFEQEIKDKIEKELKRIRDDDDNGEDPSGTGGASYSSKKPHLDDKSNEGGPSGNNTKDTLYSVVLYIWTAAMEIINAILDNISHFL